MNTHIQAGNTHKQCVSMCLLLVLASTLVALAHAGSGTITIAGNAPAVEAGSIKIDGSAPSTVNVDTWYLITANISDVDLMNDMARVQVVLYENAAGLSGNLDKERRYGVAWKTPVDNWEYLTGSGWGAVDAAYFDTTASSSWGGGNPGWGIWTFKFKFDTVSHCTAADGWTINVTATDKAGNQAWRSETFSVNLYTSITIDNTISWSASPGSNNVTASGMPFHITYKSNAIAKFQINATDPTNTFGDSFNANNLLIDDDNNANTDTHCQKLSNSPTDWWTGLGVTSSGAENAYWFVSVPAGQPTGTYTFTYTIGIEFETYAT